MQNTHGANSMERRPKLKWKTKRGYTGYRVGYRVIVCVAGGVTLRHIIPIGAPSYVVAAAVGRMADYVHAVLEDLRNWS